MRSKSTLKNIITSIIQNLVLVICGFIVPKLIITNYGSNVNGLITSITQFLAYITLLESGIGPVIKARLYKPLANKDNKEIENILSSSNKFFRVISKIFIIYVLILCFVYPMLVNSEFNRLFSISLLLIISFSILSEYFFGLTYTLLLQADQKTYVTALFKIITTIINTICIVVLIKFNANIFLVKLISTLILVIRPILINIYVKKKYNLTFNNVDKNYKLENKWDGLAQHIAAVVHNNTDIIVLTLFSTMTEVSVYSIYLLIISGIKNFVSSLTGGIDATFGDMIAKGENEKLNKSFKAYETIYLTIISIIFSCTIVLIIPFVSVYTMNIKDANYIRPLFATLIVLAEALHSIRLPYSSITLAAGHFKETMKGAWFEAISNLLISIVLVFKFGIEGVAIGTLFAMLVRTVEFNIHTSKNILYSDHKKGLLKPVVAVLEIVLIYLLLNNFNILEINSYTTWLIHSFIVLIITTIIIFIINYVLYKNDFKNLKSVFQNILRRKVIN